MILSGIEEVFLILTVFSHKELLILIEILFGKKGQVFIYSADDKQGTLGGYEIYRE